MSFPIQGKPQTAFGQGLSFHKPAIRFGQDETPGQRPAIPPADEPTALPAGDARPALSGSNEPIALPAGEDQLELSTDNKTEDGPPKTQSDKAQTKADKAQAKADAKTQRKHNRRVAESVFFRTVVPFASIGMWLLGIPGIMMGLGTSYVSGRIARRIDNKIDEEQLSGTALKTRQLIGVLGDQEKLSQEGAIVNHVNGVLDEALEPSKLATIPIVGAMLSHSGIAANLLKAVRIPTSGKFASLLGSYAKVKTVGSAGASAGASVAAKSLGSKAFLLLSAAGVNYNVAQTASSERSNFIAGPKAAWSAVSSLFLLKYLPKLFGPLIGKLEGTAGPLGKWAAGAVKTKVGHP